jgi:hypothetical protein
MARAPEERRKHPPRIRMIFDQQNIHGFCLQSFPEPGLIASRRTGETSGKASPKKSAAPLTSKKCEGRLFPPEQFK